MDVSENRPTKSTSSTSKSTNSESGSTPIPFPIFLTTPPHDKLIRHKLFLLSCEKLADLGKLVGVNIFQRKIGMLNVCRKTKDTKFSAIYEDCKNLLTDRDINTSIGPLFTRRSVNPPPPPPVMVAPPPEPSTPVLVDPATKNAYITFTPLISVSPVYEKTIRMHEYVQEPTVVPDIVPSSPPRSPWVFTFEHIVEFAARDSIPLPKAPDSDAESDSDIEDGAEAYDVFFMDEDCSSFAARKRKSRRCVDVAEKRYCDDQSQGSPMALSAPIPIPQPHVKKPNHVLDTLVPLRGFFIESR